MLESVFIASLQILATMGVSVSVVEYVTSFFAAAPAI